MKLFAGLASLKHWIRITSILFVLKTSGQDIAVGAWRTHFSYTNARILTLADEKLFCAVENGLFSYDLPSGTIRILSKIDGLSSAGITAMAYHQERKILVIGYSDGLVDLVTSEGISTIDEIANSNLEGDKQINDIAMNDREAFLATDLGVIVISLVTNQISENFVQIGSAGSAVQVKEVVSFDDSIFILTNEGIQAGTFGENLLDFNNWLRYPSTANFSSLSFANQTLYAIEENELFRLEGADWMLQASLPGQASDIIELDQEIYSTFQGQIFRFRNGEFQQLISTPASAINDLLVINGVYYIADGEVGLLQENGTPIAPGGPLFDEFSRIRVLGDEVFGFHAPSLNLYDGSQKITRYSSFKEGFWKSAEQSNFCNVSDVTDYQGVRYFSSIGDGLLNSENGEIIRDIPGSNVGSDTLLISLSSRDRLWVTGSGNEPIHALDREGNWLSFADTEVLGSSFVKADISSTGILWSLNDNGRVTTIEVNEDATATVARPGGLPASVNEFNISIEDNAWLATTEGPAFYPSASFGFSNNEAILPTFENRVLFEGEIINTVLNDGGNRVWFGTNRGLWVFDENTSELVALFDQSNSPLPSDQILQLAYDGRNGEVFIATNKGMVSYRSASSIGSRGHRNVSVFPNPVIPGYEGLVGIKGLARNAILKITDLNGNLVKEIAANGGSTSWDLLDQNGSEVVTGIYYFFSSDLNGEETFVGKIAVVR